MKKKYTKIYQQVYNSDKLKLIRQQIAKKKFLNNTKIFNWSKILELIIVATLVTKN